MSGKHRNINSESKPTQFLDDSPIQGAECGSIPKQIRHVFRNYFMQCLGLGLYACFRPV